MITNSMKLLTSTTAHQSIPVKTHKISKDRQNQAKLWSNLKEVCDLLRVNIALNQFELKDEIHFQHVHFKAGQIIYSMGQTFEKLYIVNTGFLKTVIVDELGNEQITSFPMRSDLLCLDAIHSSCHKTEAIALSDCDLIILPFQQLLALGRVYPDLEYAIYRIMSRELARKQSMSVLLGMMNSETRVKHFLISLSERFLLLGYSGKTFNLRMTRHEIGSYLGLTLETVSRNLSALHDAGLILVDQKSIELININALKSSQKIFTDNACESNRKHFKKPVTSN